MNIRKHTNSHSLQTFSQKPFIMITILLFFLLLSTASAQQPAPPSPYKFNPYIVTIIIIVIVAIFFIGFFSLYFRLCLGSSSEYSINPLRTVTRNPGLDANTIASFPVFHYSEVKELKIGKNTLECAICLNEFEDDETLRLIPNCDHVFHPECIDAWLALHVTCPVCRADLVSKPEKPEVVTLTDECVSVVSSVRVVPQDVSPEPGPVYAHALDQSPSAEAQEQSLGRRTRLFGKFSSSIRDPAQTSSLGRRTGFFGKFPRSHSTGHSIVLVHPGENTERFTLRFPDHLRKEVMTRALIRTATFNITEGSSRRSRRGGEGGSSRGARSYKRLDRAVMSDRWVITIPFFTSGKLASGDGEGSIGKVKGTGVKLPSFKCLERTTSSGVDGSGSGRPAV